MNVQMKTKTTVTQTPCVPTLKDRMFVVVSEDTRVTEENAQVFFSTIFLSLLRIL